jgi:hypothetical protein
MALATKLFPDTEILLVNWLPGPLSAALAARGVNAEPQVMMNLPLQIDATIVRVTRTSGTNRSRFVDRPIADIDVFSPSLDEAALTARLIQNLLLFSLSGTTTPDGTVQLVETVNGPRWLPDINQNITRYSGSYELHLHA